MTLEEKLGQMMDHAPAIPRLGIPEYNWWNEASHGVARAGVATVFPQAIGLAATFDAALMLRVATTISDEARAKHHEFVRQDKHGRYQGLTFFAPNLNLLRDPRWGRGHETYGEDPFLTARLGVAYIKGMQGEHPRVAKTVVTAKHFAVHSGPDADRHHFDARVSKHDLFDSYLPQFEAAVREGHVGSVMSARNAVNGEPASANTFLLDEILRKRWGFGGFVVTDCHAVRDLWQGHKTADSPEQASAMAIKAGTDLECGDDFTALGAALKAGLISAAEIDRALGRLMTARFSLGMFDPAPGPSFARIPLSRNDAPEHRALALEAARKSIVLLENRGGVLPIKPSVKKLAVIGPVADDAAMLLDNYSGTPSSRVTLLQGIRSEAARRGLEFSSASGTSVPEAVETARWADLVVLTLGLIPGEQGDRKDINLSAAQDELLRAMVATKKTVVLVLTGGGALAVPFAKAKVSAILAAWSPGEEGGTAVADVLFGKVSPAGRLPVTFYPSADALPPFADYSMKNRTYRYFTGAALWRFGHGKSYTQFKYGAPKISLAKIEAGKTAYLSIEVANAGKVDSDEVAQLYVTAPGPAGAVPIRSLVGFQRVPLRAGTRKIVSFAVGPAQLSIVDEQGQRAVNPGRFTLAVGGGQPGAGNKYKDAGEGVTIFVDVDGQPFIVP